MDEVRPQSNESAWSWPKPPEQLASVLQALGDRTLQMAELAHVIEQDQALTARLLELANSAAYSVGRPVKTIAQATMLLGTRTVRNMTVVHAVHLLAAALDAGGFDTRQFWEDSLRRASAALVLAREAGYESPSEAFTVGLVQDVGVLLLAALDPTRAAELQADRTSAASERLERELARYGRTHPELFASLAAVWRLPADLSAAVTLHHRAPPPGIDRRLRRLAELARAADAVADVTQAAAGGDSLPRARAIVEDLQSRRPLQLDGLIDLVAAETVVQSRDLDIDIGEQPRFDALVRVRPTYTQLGERLEVALREKEELARQLVTTRKALERMATTDALTGLGNRRSFAAALDQLLTDVAQNGQPLTVLAIDLDRFKRVNDGHGHAAGDDVLVEVAARLRAGLRGEDVVARLGGEEFGVLLPSCQRVDGERIAERLRAAIGQPIRGRDGSSLSVTASLGGVTLTRPSTAEHAMRVADAALYASKDSGRDRVSWAHGAY